MCQNIKAVVHINVLNNTNNSPVYSIEINTNLDLTKEQLCSMSVVVACIHLKCIR